MKIFKKVLRFGIWLEVFSRAFFKKTWKILVGLTALFAIWHYRASLVSSSETTLVKYLPLIVLLVLVMAIVTPIVLFAIAAKRSRPATVVTPPNQAAVNTPVRAKRRFRLSKAVTWVLILGSFSTGVYFISRAIEKVLVGDPAQTPVAQKDSSSPPAYAIRKECVEYGVAVGERIITLSDKTEVKIPASPAPCLKERMILEKGEESPVSDEKKLTPSTRGRVIAFSLLGLVILGVLILSWEEKRGTADKIPWGDILTQPSYIAVAGVLIFCALANLFAYPLWCWFWNEQTLFWGASLSIILFAYFKTRKEPAAKFVAKLIGLFILYGVCATIFRGYEGGPTEIFGSIFKKAEKLPEMTPLSGEDLALLPPGEIAMWAVGGCESGNRQFERDGITPLRNRPRPGQKPSSAAGKYQFIKAHWKPALDLGFRLETEIGQDGYFLYRYRRYGFQDWMFDSQYGGGPACWGPKLTALGYNMGEILAAQRRISSGASAQVEAKKDKTFDVPAGTSSEEIPIPPGLVADWGGSEGSLLVSNSLGETAKYNKEEGIVEDMYKPARYLKFQALGDKTAVVRLKFRKK